MTTPKTTAKFTPESSEPFMVATSSFKTETDSMLLRLLMSYLLTESPLISNSVARDPSLILLKQHLRWKWRREGNLSLVAASCWNLPNLKKKNPLRLLKVPVEIPVNVDTSDT